MDLNELVDKGAIIKNDIKALQADLDEINHKIETIVDFNGKKSATAQGNHSVVKLQKKENVKWLQDRLLTVKKHFPVFDSLFKTEYKPADNKQIKKTMLENPDFEKAITWASEVKPGKTYVIYENKGDENDGA